VTNLKSENKGIRKYIRGDEGKADEMRKGNYPSLPSSLPPSLSPYS
jgi:hypothetical protein